MAQTSQLGIELPFKNWRLLSREARPGCVSALVLANGERLLVKEFVPRESGMPASARAEREYVALVHLWRHRQSCGFRVPRPILRNEDPPVIVRSWIRGRPFDARLGRTLRHPVLFPATWSTRRRFERLGESIRRFTDLAPPQASGGVWSREIEHAMSRLGAPEVRVAFGEEVASRLAEEGEAPGRGSACPGLVHGDLGLWNVLWDGRSPGLIDLESTGAGPRLLNLVQVFGNLDRIRARGGLPDSRILALKKRLLSGYGGLSRSSLQEWRWLRVAFCAALLLREMRRGWEPDRLRQIGSFLADSALRAGAEIT